MALMIFLGKERKEKWRVNTDDLFVMARVIFLSLVGGDGGLFSKEVLKELSIDDPGLVLEFRWALPVVEGYGLSVGKLVLRESLFGFRGCGVKEIMGQRAEFPCTDDRISVGREVLLLWQWFF
ncbi:hypothetical protein SLE2022_153160 [Rubroshorea leprosula]